MKNIIKTFGLLAIITTFSGAFAATSRVSMVNKASPRLPSIAGYIVAGNTGTTTTSSSSTASYYDNTECIDKYTDCIKADDVCGSDMSECTTKVLFHGKMANCLSVLYQCQPSGIQALFGTNNISALSTDETRNPDGDIISYKYPDTGSVLDQLIKGAAISNQLNTEQCVKSYTRCLQRDGVCGGDFELCTSKKEFKKQALLCDSTLQRCQSEGKNQLFGSISNASALTPSDTSRIDQLIENGASLAAMNAVNTCKKVTDNCLIGACAKNPLRCVEGIKLDTINQADIIASGDTVANNTVINSDKKNPDWSTELTTATTIQKWLKTQCLETIGGNQYCHMTYREKTPSKKDLVDIDLQEDVFALAYSARKDAVNTKIQENLKKFDTKAKDACYNTIKSCAMRSCGGGLGSVCYQQAKTAPTRVPHAAGGFTTSGGDVHVNDNPYNEIKAGCSAIVNADANCIYAASAASDDGYAYTYYDEGNSTFNALFPQYDSGSEKDIIGAVGKLNALLANSYNDAAIENMKKQCQTVALSCVKSMCGKDYVNCYRNRTDIVSGTYDTGSGKLDRSMNKMGGILDYNIVIGLCMNNVKTSSVCEEHLKVATAEWRNSQYADGDSWGNNGNVRDAWLGANTTTIDTNARSNDVVIACSASNTTANGADCSGTMEPINGACAGVMDEDGCVYDTAVKQSMSEYALTNGATSLFQTLLADVEKEAQAKYNAKLTKEQNVCLANNNGGITGTSENGSAFMWVKLKGNKIPKNYQTKGLQTKDFMASNDLYGSFCRMRVTVLSDDKDIQDNLGEDATAYFAVGDAFTCGSWISQDKLNTITQKVGTRARKAAGEDSDKDKWTRTWATVAPGLVGMVGGGVLADNLQRNGASLGGILKGDGVSATKDKNKAAEDCLKQVNEARNEYYNAVNTNNDSQQRTKYFNNAVTNANKAKNYARSAGADVSDLQFTVPNAYNFASGQTFDWDDGLKERIKIIKEKSIASTYNNDTRNAAQNAQTAAQNALDYMNINKPRSKTDTGTLPGLLQEITTQCNNKLLTTIKFCENWAYDPNYLVKSSGYENPQMKQDEDSASKLFAENLNTLEQRCGEVSTEKNKSSLLATGVGAAIGGLGLGLLGNRIAWSAQQTAYEKAENKAIKEWMNDIGNHIQCYVGTEEVGTYGDAVLLEID